MERLDCTRGEPSFLLVGRFGRCLPKSFQPVDCRVTPTPARARQRKVCQTRVLKFPIRISPYGLKSPRFSEPGRSLHMRPSEAATQTLIR